jgi:hypothetical protein
LQKSQKTPLFKAAPSWRAHVLHAMALNYAQKGALEHAESNGDIKFAKFARHTASALKIDFNNKKFAKITKKATF